jgi:hydroxymethylpyrimidine/phosphomethylpyrimidine kinase
MAWVLAIGGTDSSGGAGLSRDTAMAAQMGCAVKPAVTAVTVQTNRAVQEILPVPPQVLAAQIRAALEDSRPAAVKIGMTGSAEAAAVIADTLPQDLPVVLDPVLKASSGGNLMAGGTGGEGYGQLLRRASLITPNLSEATYLSGLAEGAELAAQAERLNRLGPAAVLIKGGHGAGAEATDGLFEGGAGMAFSAPRLARGKRGTGCSLATAIACGLAQGLDLKDACARAKAQVHDWLRA